MKPSIFIDVWGRFHRVPYFLSFFSFFFYLDAPPHTHTHTCHVIVANYLHTRSSFSIHIHQISHKAIPLFSIASHINNSHKSSTHTFQNLSFRRLQTNTNKQTLWNQPINFNKCKHSIQFTVIIYGLCKLFTYFFCNDC